RRQNDAEICGTAGDGNSGRQDPGDDGPAALLSPRHHRHLGADAPAEALRPQRQRLACQGADLEVSTGHLGSFLGFLLSGPVFSFTPLFSSRPQSRLLPGFSFPPFPSRPPPDRVRSYPQASSLSPDLVRTLLFYALQAWGNASALTFREAPGAGADILVDFSRSFHEDGYPFDGPGSTLAHAFFPGEHPISGDTHFDDEETWIYDPQAKQQGQQGVGGGLAGGT
uniref:Peptidase metallopeptidase domain-containing protein n=1 Tax=Chrysemys picta bellii TaxID=8478 RepID=A0A8C3FNA1_CHRPI